MKLTLSVWVRQGRWGTISLVLTLVARRGIFRLKKPLYSLSLANDICETKERVHVLKQRGDKLSDTIWDYSAKAVISWARTSLTADIHFLELYHYSLAFTPCEIHWQGRNIFIKLSGNSNDEILSLLPAIHINRATDGIIFLHSSDRKWKWKW